MGWARLLLLLAVASLVSWTWFWTVHRTSYPLLSVPISHPQPPEVHSDSTEEVASEAQRIDVSANAYSPRLPAATLPEEGQAAAIANPAVPAPDTDASRRPISPRPDTVPSAPGGGPSGDAGNDIEWYKAQYEAVKRSSLEDVETAIQQDRERRVEEQKTLLETTLSQRLAAERADLEKEFDRKLALEMERFKGDAQNTVTQELDRMFALKGSATDLNARIFDPDLANRMAKTHEVPLYGFKRCSILEGAVFNPWVHLGPISGNLMTANPPRALASSMVDALALKVHDNIMSWADGEKFDTVSVTRFACYMAAHGRNEYALMTDGMWLLHVDGQAYFPDLTLKGPGDLPFDASQKGIRYMGEKWEPANALPAEPEINSTKQRRDGGSEGDGNRKEEEQKEVDKNEQEKNTEEKDVQLRKHIPPRTPAVPRLRYKIAYLLLVHERLDIFQTLFDALYDTDGLFLIHVDSKRGEFKNRVHEWLLLDPHYREAKNIFVMPNSFNLNWGASSIVFGQLEGFFTLADIADWDYLINLSGYDYPLRSTKSIHAILERDPGKVYIEHWTDPEVEWRLERAFFLSASQTAVRTPTAAPDRRFALDHRFRAMKHHQWMILPRAFVQHLRQSQDAHDLLAWSEHSWIPDESYFAMVALSHASDWAPRIVNDCKRFIYFEPDALHPIWLRNGDEGKLEKGASVEIAMRKQPGAVVDGVVPQREFFFVRKINSLWEKGIRGWMDRKRDEVDRALEEEIKAIDERIWQSA
ncbi:hypothetical protein HKX48_005308 [Thoreauomyces humboldtii]|nr:hypothetical protein HKX48_005308 [Thoreauomyces humboldtii]